MKRFKILGCLGLFVPLLGRSYAYELYPSVNIGSTYYNMGSSRTDSVVGGSSSFDMFLSNNTQSGTVGVEYYRSDYSSWYATTEFGLQNNTSSDYIFTFAFGDVYEYANNPKMVNSSPNSDSVDYVGWVDNVAYGVDLESDNIDSNNITADDFMQAGYYLGENSPSFIRDFVDSSSVDTAAFVGSIVIGVEGVKNGYTKEEFENAWADFWNVQVDAPDVPDFDNKFQSMVVKSNYSAWTYPSYNWVVYGANTRQNVFVFSALPTDSVLTLTPQQMMDKYNNSTGGNMQLYTPEQIINMLSPDFDGDVSLGSGSTNNFVGVLKSLFMPTYTGIENNYNDMIDNLGVLYMPIDYIFGILATIQSNYNSDMVLEWGNIDIWDNRFLNAGIFRFSPASVFPSDLFIIAQYFAMFGVLAGLSIATWRHLFGSDGSEGGSAI